MPVIVHYRVQPTYAKNAITMCGVFRSRQKYDEFAQNEVQRTCYKSIPFIVEQCREISEDEYKNIDALCRGGCKNVLC